VDNLANNVDNASNAIDGASNSLETIDSGGLDSIAASADDAGLSMEQVGEAASSSGYSISQINPEPSKKPKSRLMMQQKAWKRQRRLQLC
jgi:hypothetical protein